MVLRITKRDWEAIREHGRQAYPFECCGVMVGRIDERGVKTAHAAIACENIRKDSHQNRYEISPAELLRIQRECRESGDEIIGFYHSHPDHPPQWSATDLADAHWFGCSYVITAVIRGEASETRSFVLVGDPGREETKRFEEEAIDVIDFASGEASRG